MSKPPLHPDNKVWTLTPKFITSLKRYFRELRLKRYKKKKIKESKTPHQRYYMVKFKIKIADDYNPQESDLTYEMIVSAHAAFFAKKMVENDIKRKLEIDFSDFEEMSDEEYEIFLKTRDEHILKQKRGLI